MQLAKTSNDHSFPFGSPMDGSAFGGVKYRFGFNGKENDNEVKGEGNSLDFGARIYDSRLGRWLSLDPLAGQYPYVSPYNYALNSPIQAIDPNGKLVIFVNGFRPWKTVGEVIGEKHNVFKTDKYDYWDDMDDKFMDRINDKNAVYADGAAGAYGYYATASFRYKNGKEAGQDLISKINSGEVVLQRDEAGKVIETIKIVAHSQGCAEAAGMSEVLIKAGYTVEVIYNISPKQPGDFTTPSGVGRIVQYGSDKDMIAPQSDMPGVKESVKMPNNRKNGPIGGHLLGNYGWIFNILKGEPGEVKKGSDVVKKQEKLDKKAQEAFDKNFKVKK